mgnify:CR=1 FL=1
MSYLSLYRQYRPSTFEDLVGQDHIKRTIMNALLRRKVPHAYLFTGPRGTGKTSASKLIAKGVNCLSPFENGNPCNSCANCEAANKGTMNDIIEIDAASNNGVDEIRNIRDQVHFAPAQGKYKVYIIDEVHMLTVGAFNALLKTLEEPPKHVIFILATTEPHKVLSTIVSRCQRLDFRRISPKDIVDRMKFIVQDQNLEVEDEALHLIANIAQGGMRDALSLLDQSISYAEGKVTALDVTTIVGKTSIRFVGNVIELIEKGDLSGLIDQVDEIIETGKEPEYFIEDLIGYYRDLLIYQSTNNPGHMSTAVVDEQFKSLAGQLQSSLIQQMVTELLGCQSELKWTKQAKTTIEVTLIKLLDFKNMNTPKEQDGSGGITGVLIEQISVLRQEIMNIKKGTSLNVQNTTSSSKLDEPNTPSEVQKTSNVPDVRPVIEQVVLPTAEKVIIEYVRSRYDDILNYIGNTDAELNRLLADSQPVLCSKQHLVISFPTSKSIEDAYNLNIVKVLEHSIEQTLGQSLTIVLVENEVWHDIKKNFTAKRQQQPK